MKHTLLNLVLVCTGVLVGVSSIGAVYMLNERRDDQMRLIQRTEAWARYETAVDACDRGLVLRARINSLTDAKRGELIPTVNCQQAIPKPSIPPP